MSGRQKLILILCSALVAVGPGCSNDLGGGGGGGGGGGYGCQNVDLLIAVDGSGSMEEELAAMRDTIFPAFAQRLPTISQGLDDFRTATIDACPSPSNFHTRGAGGDCGFSGGNAWIESSSPKLQNEFACVGDIYQDDIACSGNNDDEQPASAAAASLEAGGSNAEFSRDEALLVVVAITDEDEQPTGSQDTADEVFDRLIATKGGDVRRMVFLGVGGGSECSGVYGDVGRPAEKLLQITNKFIANDRGVWWDLCDGRLEDGLEEAFSVIESACDELPPPVVEEPPGDECTTDGECTADEFCSQDGYCLPQIG